MIGIDTWGTYHVYCEGDYDAAAKKLVLEGTNEEPGLGEVPFRFTFDLASEDETVLTLEFIPPGAEPFTMFRQVSRKK